MCNKVVEKAPWIIVLYDVPDHLKTQEMCNRVVRTVPNAFHRIPDHFKTQEMCKKAVEKDPRMLKCVPDHFKAGLVCS